MDLTLDEFAAQVGADGPVTIAGSGSRGGAVPDVRTVSAPAGIERIDAAEMVVECGAATPVDELLTALAEHGQTVSLPAGGTVGGALAVGHSAVTRLGHGAMRDVLLQTRYVSAAGKLTKAGGPTVKNVSGFDLCRLFVGARGTLGLFGDVILRTRPVPRHSGWYTSDRDPSELLSDIYRPVALLWDGDATHVRLDGDDADIGVAVERFELQEAAGPPALPGPYRWSVAPSMAIEAARSVAGSFVVELGVGVVHHSAPGEHHAPDVAKRELHDRIKQQFDPTGRLNPGVDPLAPPATR
ncbi:MAG: FAD-binding protein [Ilumatobacter sp.]|uniref:FAD-binding protein n=1 Tax=Ilumatobacter sp. TaxID=1967498 RepID=UPI003C73A37F